MADAAVQFLLNNITDLLKHQAHLLLDTKKNIESLERDLSFFNGSLKESLKSRKNNELAKVVDRNIREAVYEVEDVIDEFVTQASEVKSTSSFKFWKSAARFHEIGRKIDEVKEKVERARNELLSLKVDDEDKSRISHKDRLPRLTDVVGFVDVIEELRLRLIKETDYFDVVSLIGMLGLGKTTIAWKVYNDPTIVYGFPVRIWLSISQEFSDKDIFLAIIKEFITITDDIRQKEIKDLALLVTAYLENKRFLIVMDDVWTRADWDRLKYALPKNNNNGKILITSRNEDVGKYACNPTLPHRLRFFNPEESWELLQLEALRTLNCPPGLEIVGKLIASSCKGLPLAIVVIGGILATKYSPLDITATERAWKKVSEQVGNYLNHDPGDRMSKFISLSYDRLPYHLRACFLYLGMFPEDFEIPAWKLILMWIGEGFIQQSDDSSLEETAEEYLEDLINQNLIRIDKLKPDGKVKTCRIHDALRDFCRIESANENFLQEIKSKNGIFSPPISDLHRRLSIHSNCLEFFSSKPVGSRVRSFVCFSKDKLILPDQNIADVLKAFKLVRIIDVNCIMFPKINNDLFRLVHVRYIAISFCLSILPKNFSHLWNLQTLIVETTSKIFDVKADIGKFIQLRLFKTNAYTTLPKPSNDSKHGKELHTLGTISVESCTTELFQRARKLKKLGIRGQLSLLLEGKKGSFDSLRKMENLENLKLINDLLLRPLSEGKLDGLPQPHQFPSGLRSLTLRATFLEWSNMSVLGELKNLEVLKLKDKAFMGKTWVATDGGFPKLGVLVIKDSDLEVWAASSDHYPRLKGLVLHHCEKLHGVPAKLADIDTFQMLELYNCKSAVTSAERVKEAKEKTQAGVFAFKLSIFPPSE